MVILNQRRMFFDAFGGVLVASRMYVSTSALLSCYERVFITKKNSIFHDFGILDLRTTEPFRSDSRTFFSNLRTFRLKNLRTREPSNLRTFGLIGCNHLNSVFGYNLQTTTINANLPFNHDKSPPQTSNFNQCCKCIRLVAI